MKKSIVSIGVAIAFVALLLYGCFGKKHESPYDQGYAAGYEEGRRDGYSEGYDTGTFHGYDDGYDDGYDAGYFDGLLDDDTVVTEPEGGWPKIEKDS